MAGQQRRGVRLDVYVTRALPGTSRSRVQAAIRAGWITVDGAPARSGSSVRPGALIECRLPATHQAPEMAPEPMDLDVRHADDHVLVVYKPPGLVVHPTYGHLTGTLANGLMHLLGHPPGIVHRIDKGTSGLLAVARTPEALRRLQRALRAHDLERSYLALVHGRPKSGWIEGALAADPRDRRRRAVVPEGHPGAQWARTHVEVLDPGPISLVRCTLETGRRHQIRVHLAHTGHPLVGDVRYGGRCEGIDRPALHAAVLGFDHPMSKRRIRLTAGLPDDMRACLRNAGPTRCSGETPQNSTSLSSVVERDHG